MRTFGSHNFIRTCVSKRHNIALHKTYSVAMAYRRENENWTHYTRTKQFGWCELENICVGVRLAVVDYENCSTTLCIIYLLSIT